MLCVCWRHTIRMSMSVNDLYDAIGHQGTALGRDNSWPVNRGNHPRRDVCRRSAAHRHCRGATDWPWTHGPDLDYVHLRAGRSLPPTSATMVIRYVHVTGARHCCCHRVIWVEVSFCILDEKWIFVTVARVGHVADIGIICSCTCAGDGNHGGRLQCDRKIPWLDSWKTRMF